MDNEKNLFEQFWQDGWVVMLVGAAGMLARLLSDNKKDSIVEQTKKIISAAIMSGIAWFILEQIEISSLWKAVTYGLIGVISPEILNGVVKLAKRFQNNPEKYIK